MLALNRVSVQKSVDTEHRMHSVKNQANSFATIKACYPFTIKGELFSLLCYQPRGDPSFFENPDTYRYRQVPVFTPNLKWTSQSTAA